MARPPLTPCMICEKAVLYLWKEKLVDNDSTTNLDGACGVFIHGDYGSIFDLNEYAAIICDDCVDKLIQSKRIRFVRERPITFN
jgi:hypothetical protein